MTVEGQLRHYHKIICGGIFKTLPNILGKALFQKSSKTAIFSYVLFFDKNNSGKRDNICVEFESKIKDLSPIF